MLVASSPTTPSPWAFQWHPEVWVLVVGLVASYVYAIRSIGPHANRRRGDEIVTRRQLWSFVGAIALLWVASDWPIHDVGENNLYSVHMLQHMMLSYFMPPLVLLATPEWLARAVIGEGRAYRIVRWFTRPVVAAVMFNLVVMVTHVPAVVNAAVVAGQRAAILHYALHAAVVLTSLVMWMPVCGPLPEVRIHPGAKMGYLFVQSIIPTVPAGWLTFAEGAVYKAYDKPAPRVFGLSVTYDQQIAGLIMKVGGSVFLWTLVTVLFFRRFMRSGPEDYGFEARRRAVAAAAHAAAGEPIEGTALTFDDVKQVFDANPAPEEPAH